MVGWDAARQSWERILSSLLSMKSSTSYVSVTMALETDSVRVADPSIQEAFAFCEHLTRAHYENFPVASFLIPRSLRPHVAAIYAFARIADDYADEGSLRPEERLQKLDDWKRKLEDCFVGSAEHPVFVALRESVRRVRLPQKPLADLLTAFRMDVTTSRYATFGDVRNYCEHSANPIGRLVLHLFGAASEEAVGYSDHICTALQLANFWQDVAIDWQKGRLYIPLEDVERFAYSEEGIARKSLNDSFRALMRFELDRTRALFLEGKPLLGIVPHRLRFELRLTWLGGMRILEKIQDAGYDVLTRHPKISTADKLALVARAFAFRNL